MVFHATYPGNHPWHAFGYPYCGYESPVPRSVPHLGVMDSGVRTPHRGRMAHAGNFNCAYLLNICPSWILRKLVGNWLGSMVNPNAHAENSNFHILHVRGGNYAVIPAITWSPGW